MNRESLRARLVGLSVLATLLGACAPREPARAPAAVAAPPVVAVQTPAPPAPAPRPPPAPSEPAVESVIADASAHGLPTLLVFHTIWCKPCATLEANVLHAPPVLEALAGYRVQKYDAEVDAGAGAAQRFQVSSYPTLLVLSPRGEEIGRLYEQDVDGLARALAAIRPVALHAPVADAVVAQETDARTLLKTGQIVERGGDLDRARRAYRAAITRSATSAKDVAGTAAFALVRLDARAQDLRSHGKALASFAAAYPGSFEALGAIDGLTVLPVSARPDRATLRRAATLVVAARRTAAMKDEPTLRALSVSLASLGDAEDATSAVAGLPPPQAEGADVPVVTVPKKDPLAEPCSSVAAPPPEFIAMFRRTQQIARHIVDACGSEARHEDEEEVRLYIKDRGVERALLLDPEAPEPLRRCVEGAARLETEIPALFGAKRIISVKFGPGH